MAVTGKRPLRHASKMTVFPSKKKSDLWVRRVNEMVEGVRMTM